ncbi:unnamed protein product, partial [marine sediment metagenome]
LESLSESLSSIVALSKVSLKYTVVESLYK